MIALITQFADFGADYTGIGWLTVVLPLALLAFVVALWFRAYRRDGGEPSDTPVASGNSEGSSRTDSAMLLPLLPAFMLPLALALALTVVVAVLWWHTTRRAQH
jgi:hypothetical protein